MSEPLISLRGVNKWYGTGAGRQQILFAVDVEILEGELVSIVGTSGSGKSTLLNIVGGLDRQYQGTVEVLGRRYGKLSDRQLSKLRNQQIGFVFQAFNLLDHLTCWENVALPAFFGKPRENPQKRAEAMLERVGLGKKIHAKPSNLSGGQKQRVAIARALFNEPKLLLCDEPTGNLDSKTGAQIIDMFSMLNSEEGITVLIVTHEIRVSRVADRHIRLEDGRVVDVGPMEHDCVEPEGVQAAPAEASPARSSDPSEGEAPDDRALPQEPSSAPALAPGAGALPSA